MQTERYKLEECPCCRRNERDCRAFLVSRGGHTPSITALDRCLQGVRTRAEVAEDLLVKCEAEVVRLRAIVEGRVC